ncbi:hypothetical protein Avbf_00266 [Armadillidium vulgare]|nr:hypothetical protein Avbf_00266 [Armadillidium vulgare]
MQWTKKKIRIIVHTLNTNLFSFFVTCSVGKSSHQNYSEAKFGSQKIAKNEPALSFALYG